MNKSSIKELLFLSLFYMLIHVGMLFLTGTFWDDWISFFHDVTSKNLEGFESGRPYYSAAVEMVWNLPFYGYRKLAFLLYWASYIFIYDILKKSRLAKPNTALFLTILCMAMPINDARVLLANFPYALGFFTFFLGTDIFMCSFNSIRAKPIVRVAILSLYLLSFTLNSNLVMYGCVLLFILFKMQTVKRCFLFADFFILPIAFYALNKILFPVHGAYADYNEVSVRGLLRALILLPGSTVYNIENMLSALIKYKKLLYIAGISVIPLFIYEFKTKGKIRHTIFDDDDDSLFIFCVGVILFFAGLFPYIVVRQGMELSVIGIKSRDTIHLGLGSALILYAILSRKLRVYILSAMVVLGFFHFNIWYLNYQREWYRQLSFQNEVAMLEEIKEGGNFIVYEFPESKIEDARFYTWTGNTVSVIGRQNVLMLDCTTNNEYLFDEDTRKSMVMHCPMFGEYDLNNTSLKGYLYFNCPLSLKKTIKLKIFEIFSPSSFFDSISELGSLEFLKEPL